MPKCLSPLDDVPSDWDVTFTENHWENEISHEKSFPHMRAELQLGNDFPYLVTYDRF